MNASAVLDAQRNAEINGIKNCNFVCGKVKHVFLALPDFVLLCTMGSLTFYELNCMSMIVRHYRQPDLSYPDDHVS